MSTFYTYEHIRPDTGVVFYVGKGARKRAYKKDGRNSHWRNVVLKNNGKFDVRIINWFKDEDSAFESEQWHINSIKHLGNLVNKTSGGEGISGLKHTEESRAKMRKPKSDIAKLNMSAAKSGKPGRRISDSERAKLSSERKGSGNPMFGKKMSEEARAHLSDISRGRTHSEESKAKMSIARSGDKHHLYGKSLSEEVKRKISESMKRIRALEKSK